MEARAHIVAVLAMRGDPPQLLKTDLSTAGLNLSPWSNVSRPGKVDPATTLVLTDKLSPDGTLNWSPPPGAWQVFEFKQYAANTSVLGSAGLGPQLVLDHFDKAAFALHLARVGDPMIGALGATKPAMRATFIDSLELMQDLPWTQRFLEEFKSRRGYDLTPYLAFIIQPGWMQAWNEHYSLPYYQTITNDEMADRAREDYRQTVSDLIIDNFVKPFVEWNHRHGLLAKFQAHGGPMDLIRGYGLVDIPETENLGNDYDALGIRFARSAADMYGRTLVSAESLAFKDHPFDRTPAWLRARIDLFFAAGVNAESLHGYPYTSKTATWPGWYPFSPSAFTTGFGTMFSQTNPTWAAMPVLAEYMARTNAVMRRGSPIVPVALFFGEVGNYKGIEDQGAGAEAPEKLLIASGYDYDRINPDGLEHSRVIRRQLVTSGGHAYSALIFPRTTALRADTAEKLASFAQAGLPVFFVETIPHRDVGLLDAEHRDSRVRQSVADVLRNTGRLVPEDKLGEALDSERIPANLRFTASPADVDFVERKVHNRLVYFLYNCSDEPRNASFVAPVLGGVQRWNALDGTIEPKSARTVAHGTEIELNLRTHESALLVVDPATKPHVFAAADEVGVQVLEQAGWQLDTNGHSNGGMPFARKFENVTLADYAEIPQLSTFSGVGIYSRDFAASDRCRKSGCRAVLDLGIVHDMATVTLNGHRLPPLIAAPWQRDITPWLKSTGNRIEIAVANLPQNAVHDSTKPGFNNLPLLPAGLLGPVTIRFEQRHHQSLRMSYFKAAREIRR